MAIVVRPSMRRSKAAWMSRSVTVSSAEVASSRMRMRGSLSSTRAMRDALLLAARQLVAALADDRVVALGQLDDPVVDRRRAGRRLELLLGRVGRRVAEVVADRGVEQVGLLGHDPDDLAERGQGEPADVDAVDLDRARVDVVEPRDQVGRRRLARARRADERHELARLGLEVDVLEAEGGARRSGRSRAARPRAWPGPRRPRRAAGRPRPRPGRSSAAIRSARAQGVVGALAGTASVG